MADSRHGDERSGARREDQFTRPPSFRDGHDSAPLSADGAVWSPGSSQGVSFGVGFAILAGIAAVAFMALAPGGSPDLTPGVSAADGPDDVDPGAQGNVTSGLPLPSVSGTPTALPGSAPTLPPLP